MFGKEVTEFTVRHRNVWRNVRDVRIGYHLQFAQTQRWASAFTGQSFHLFVSKSLEKEGLDLTTVLTLGESM